MAGWMARHRQGLAWSSFAFLLVLAPRLFTSSLELAVLTQIGVAIIACLAFNILLGQGGLLSFGHAIYSGLGGFLTLHALNAVAAGGLVLPVSLLPLLGGAAGLALAVPLGYLSTRRGGTAFAMITLGLGELMWALAPLLPGFFGGEGGIFGNRVVGARPLGLSLGPQLELYYLVACYGLVCTALMYAFTRTPLGRMLEATRERPERVGFVGYDVRQVRWLAFMISAFFMGVAGGLAALDFERVTAEAFGTARSANLLLFTVLGGSTVFFGPVIGAVLMVVASVLLSELSRAWLLYLGLVFIAMVMHAPGGLAGLLLAHLRVAEQGLLARLLGPYVLLLLAALPTLLAFAALAEMAYLLQADSGPGAHLQVLGLALDPRQAAPWLLGILVLLLGIVLFEIARRRFLCVWREVQGRIAVRPGGAR